MLTPIAHTGLSFNPAALKGIHLPAGIADPADTIEMMGGSMQLKRNAEIYDENEPADYLYKMASGAVRTYKVLTDGRRQIGTF
jgi:CRP/FNR family nitrogen fixation transcriptional regulator